MTEKTDPRLIYLYDALCSWCYGFEPVLREVAERYAEEYPLQLVSGGMNIGDRVARIKDILGPTPEVAYRRVAETSRAEFTDAYLKDLVERDNYLVDSLPPALALAAFRSQADHAGRDLEFGYALQKAMYHEGLAPTSDEYILSAADDLGVDGNGILEGMRTDAARAGADADFALAADLGVRGFPAVFLTDGRGQYVQVGSGYTPAEQLDSNVRQGSALLAAQETSESDPTDDTAETPA